MERFLGFYNVETKTGDLLFKTIDQAMSYLKLNAKSYLVGQGYDGAANMNGKHKGLSTLIQNKYPRAM